jgi:hypothetical protein
MICDSCQREVEEVRGSMWHGEDRICLECFYEWYDPDDPLTTFGNATSKARIGNFIRSKYGLEPLV